MIETIKSLLKPIASLRVTIVLLLLTMVLVFAGTTAQREMGVQDVQHQIFHSWYAKIYFHYFFQPAPSAPSGYGHAYFYLPGGFAVMVAILVNLLAAHTLRFKFRAKRIGIILIHFGPLSSLSVGEILTSQLASEGQMRLDFDPHGRNPSAIKATNYSEDIRYAELAITDHSPADHDDVTVISQSRLQAASGGPAIHDAKLPFDVTVTKWVENSMVADKNETPLRLADTGPAKSIGIIEVAKISGTGSDASRSDIPSAFITISKNGTSYGTYLVSLLFDRSYYDQTQARSQAVVVDGKTYNIDLRNPDVITSLTPSNSWNSSTNGIPEPTLTTTSRAWSRFTIMMVPPLKND